LSNYVVCLKYGDKYSASYVNRLYNMVQRNLSLDHEFICYTEDPTDIDSGIRIEPLPALAVQGWWFKPMFFNPELGLKGIILFLDLDIVIFENINNLFEYMPGKFCIIRDFNRHLIKNYPKFNSSIFRLETGQHSNIYSEFIRDISSITRRFQGDQDWIRHCIKLNFEYWPDEWIRSYKWEMRSKPKIDASPRGKRDFITTGVPTVLCDTSVAVFHGEPNPHNCKDPWVINNWK